MVNNAGVITYGRFDQTPLGADLALLQTNLTAVVALTKLALPGMVARGRGRILNVGSTGSFAPGPYGAAYCAGKAFVLSFSEALAEELAGTGVTVMALCPGATRTQMQARAAMSEVRLLRFGVMDASVVAAAGYRGLMAGRRIVVPGIANQVLTWLNSANAARGRHSNFGLPYAKIVPSPQKTRTFSRIFFHPAEESFFA